MASLMMALLLVGAASQHATPEAAAECVRRFYSTYKSMPNYGIPDPPDLARLAPRMSRRLNALIAGALRYRASLRCGDCKPPYSDGNFFTSNVEGYTSFSIGTPSTMGTRYRVPVQFEYVDATDPKHPARWSDAAIVIEERDVLVIDDIEFRADWPYANHGLLSAGLKERP